MWVKEIWRYPVKSMAGELLETAELAAAGVRGDRILQVTNPAGKVMTSRTRPLLLRHHAALNEKSLVLVDGRPWDSAEVARDVEAAAGAGCRLVESDEVIRFDILPLLIATDGMIEATGYDRRRFRPNLVIGGVEGMTEREWEGARLKIGSVVIAMQDLRARCIMTTFDPDTGKQDLQVLGRIRKEFDGRLGLNSSVAIPGTVAVGDTVEVIPAS